MIRKFRSSNQVKEKCDAPSVVFSRVSLEFEGQPLFRELDFSVVGGECTCILGPSGCGKSTLLRLVSGAGALKYDGVVEICSSGGSEGAQGDTAWMSQKDLLLPWMTLLDNILLGAKLRGEITSVSIEKANDLITEAGLEGYERALPSTLSGGMRQRGALLRTLMEGRSILLMDEPFSALDALTRMKLQDLSAKMTKGATVLLVTHDPMEALRMANTVVVLSGRPAVIKKTLPLRGTPPRDADDPEIQLHYSELLHTLMNGGEE